jgi:2-haloacid dehalogenase
MNRRSFFGAASMSVAASLAAHACDRRAGDNQSRRSRSTASYSSTRARSRRSRKNCFPGKGAALVNTWRTRQFEYTWLRTLTSSYADFWQVTSEALQFSCASHGLVLGDAARERLMQAHLNLPAWPDVAPALQRLRAAGVRLALLSNFTRAMLDANLKSASLEEYFDVTGRLSTDDVRAFKPASAAYEMGTRHFRLRRENILFAAFGGWDAAGAKRFGFPVFWCNRMNQPPEQLGVSADHVAATIAELPAIAGA